jgi:RimJ/RimL family protein N-acetyltransferase
MKPILLDIPDTIETERLLIRVPRAGDGAALQEAFLESHDRLKPWFPWAQGAGSVEEREVFVREKYASFIKKEDMTLGVYLKSDNKFIGGSGLHFHNLAVPSFEIGYWIRTGYEGKGYITEAVNAITKFGFEILNANRIYIRCDYENFRSQAVAKRAGYIYEGTFRNYERKHDTGELTHMMYFALTAEDYRRMVEQ